MRKDNLVIGKMVMFNDQKVMILNWSPWGINAPGTSVNVRFPDGSAGIVYHFELKEIVYHFELEEVEE